MLRYKQTIDALHKRSISLNLNRNSTYLLPKTDSRTGIEGSEDEGIFDEIFVQPFIQETIGIKFKG